MQSVCALLVKRKILTEEMRLIIQDTYADGFHVYFRHITESNNEVLGRTAEYLAAGYFHNSQITRIDHRKKNITFRYKKHVNRISGEKLYAEKTLGIFEFMARILYYLPDKHSKQIRWYGLYANGVREKLKKRTWVCAVKNSFKAEPELCPKCKTAMVCRFVFSYNVVKAAKRLRRMHACIDGYFVPYKNDP